MYKTIIILAILSAMLPNPASAQDVVNALTDLQNDRVEIIYNHAKAVSNNTQISIAFIENGLTNYYGIIKEDEILKSIENKDKLFEIGSITKVFTATLLANAVLDNKIGLEDDISKFYDFPFRDSVRIDFLSLANHTSALESIPSNLDISDFLASQTKAVQQNPYQTYGEKDLEAYLKNEIKLGYMPQKQYNYSNFGMGLLGYTLSLLSNSSYERLISNEIFEKYNMTNSHTNIDHAKTSLVKGISEDGSFANNWLWDSDVIIGAGGILSTVTDLSKFACAQFDFANRELALTRIPTFTINEKMKVGLGWHIIDNGDNRVLYWHNGGTGGYSSSMILDVKEKKGIIILSNVSVFHPEMNKIDSMCFQLMNAIK